MADKTSYRKIQNLKKKGNRSAPLDQNQNYTVSRQNSRRVKLNRENSI